MESKDSVIDLNYYKIVAETQTDPKILKAELMDLISEVENENRYCPCCDTRMFNCNGRWFCMKCAKAGRICGP